MLKKTVYTMFVVSALTAVTIFPAAVQRSSYLTLTDNEMMECICGKTKSETEKEFLKEKTRYEWEEAGEGHTLRMQLARAVLLRSKIEEFDTREGKQRLSVLFSAAMDEKYSARVGKDHGANTADLDELVSRALFVLRTKYQEKYDFAVTKAQGQGNDASYKHWIAPHSSNGLTAIHFAAFFGLDDVVEKFLLHSPDHLAEISELRLDQGYFRGVTPLHLASMNSRIGVVERFCSHARVDGVGGERQAIDLNVRDGAHCTALHYAITHSFNPRIVQALCDAGANVNLFDQRGYLPIDCVYSECERHLGQDIEALTTGLDNFLQPLLARETLHSPYSMRNPGRINGRYDDNLRAFIEGGGTLDTVYSGMSAIMHVVHVRNTPLLRALLADDLGQEVSLHFPALDAAVGVEGGGAFAENDCPLIRAMEVGYEQGVFVILKAAQRRNLTAGRSRMLWPFAERTGDDLIRYMFQEFGLRDTEAQEIPSFRGWQVVAERGAHYLVEHLMGGGEERRKADVLDREIEEIKGGATSGQIVSENEPETQEVTAMRKEAATLRDAAAAQYEAAVRRLTSTEWFEIACEMVVNGEHQSLGELLVHNNAVPREAPGEISLLRPGGKIIKVTEKMRLADVAIRHADFEMITVLMVANFCTVEDIVDSFAREGAADVPPAVARAQQRSLAHILFSFITREDEDSLNALLKSPAICNVLKGIQFCVRVLRVNEDDQVSFPEQGEEVVFASELVGTDRAQGAQVPATDELLLKETPLHFALRRAKEEGSVIKARIARAFAEKVEAYAFARDSVGRTAGYYVRGSEYRERNENNKDEWENEVAQTDDPNVIFGAVKWTLERYEFNVDSSVPVSIADVVRCNKASEIDILRYADILISANKRERPTAILLFGPRGCGKATVARALAEASNRLWVTPKLESFVLNSWERGEGRYDAVDDNLKFLEECERVTGNSAETDFEHLSIEEGQGKRDGVLVFLGNIDSVCKQLDSESSLARPEPECPGIKRVIDRIRRGADSNIVFVATTHAPRVLDPALREQFNVKIEVPYPTTEERKAELGALLQAIDWIDFSAQGGDPYQVAAKMTGNFSRRRIRQMVERMIQYQIAEQRRVLGSLGERGNEQFHDVEEEIGEAEPVEQGCAGDDELQDALPLTQRSDAPLTGDQFLDAIKTYLDELHGEEKAEKIYHTYTGKDTKGFKGIFYDKHNHRLQEIITRSGRMASLSQAGDEASLATRNALHCSIFLYGEPGTGKSLFAKAFSDDTKYFYFSHDANQFLASHVGEGAENVRNFFRLVRNEAGKQGVVIFIDEFDSVGGPREGNDGAGGSQAYTQVANALLTAIQRFNDDRIGVIIAASNRKPEELDEALMSRFQLKIEVPLPTHQVRTEMLNFFIDKISKDGITLQTLPNHGHFETCVVPIDGELTPRQKMFKAFGDIGQKLQVEEAAETNKVCISCTLVRDEELGDELGAGDIDDDWNLYAFKCKVDGIQVTAGTNADTPVTEEVMNLVRSDRMNLFALQAEELQDSEMVQLPIEGQVYEIVQQVRKMMSLGEDGKVNLNSVRALSLMAGESISGRDLGMAVKTAHQTALLAENAQLTFQMVFDAITEILGSQKTGDLSDEDVRRMLDYALIDLEQMEGYSLIHPSDRRKGRLLEQFKSRLGEDREAVMRSLSSVISHAALKAKLRKASCDGRVYKHFVDAVANSSQTFESYLDRYRIANGLPNGYSPGGDAPVTVGDIRDGFLALPSS